MSLTTSPEEVIRSAAQPPLYITYSTELWKGIRKVFKCDFCGSNRDDADSMIEHVLLHYPLARQNELLDYMIKEKQKHGS